MESVITPKSIPDGNTWYGNIKAGGPTPPSILEKNEQYDEPKFVHPAEKPKAIGQVNRETLVEPKYY